MELYNNRKFLQKIGPIKVILRAFFIWAIIFFTAPLDVRIEINSHAYLFIFLSVVSFASGTLFLGAREKSIVVPKSTKHLKKLFMIIFYLAIIGLGVKLIDRFVLRGLSLDADAFSNRESMEQSGGSLLAIVSAILSPMGLFPLFIMWKYNMKLSYLFSSIVFVLFFAQLFDAFLLSSRSIMFVLFVMIGLYLFYFKKIKLTLKKALVLLLALFSFLFLMNYIFLERTGVFAGDQVYDVVLNQSNYNFTLTSNQQFQNKFDKMNPLSQSIAFIYITNAQYFTHGMIEFSYLYDKFGDVHAWGNYTFWVYVRFLSQIVGGNFEISEILELIPRQGIYTTFFGPIYIDFGWLGIIFMFILGNLVRRIYEKAKSGSDWAILMYFYFFIVLMFSPVFNFISGAGGVFVLTSIILFSIISQKFYKYGQFS